MSNSSAHNSMPAPPEKAAPSEARKELARHQLPVLVVSIGALLLFYQDIIALPLRHECLLVTVIALLSLITVVRSNENGIWSPPSLLLVLILIFHFGMVGTYAIGLEGGPLTERDTRIWFTENVAQVAIYLSALGVVGYAIGANLGIVLFRRPEAGGSDNEWQDRVLTYAGVGLVTVGALWWTYIALQTGFIGSSYSQFRSLLRGNLGIPQAVDLFTWGLIMLAAASSSRLRTLGFAVFGLVAVPYFSVGARGQVLFPLFTALATIGLRKRLMPLIPAIVIAVGLLFSVSVVRNVRAEGLAAVDSTQEMEGNIVEGVNELGFTLRCVAITVWWRQMGDELMYGASYWAPFDRGLARIIPGREQPDPLEDKRLLGVLMGQTWGALGWSGIAEAYYNFGTPGVIFILLGLGGLVTWMALWPPTPYYRALFGLLMYPIFYTVRNSFVMVPLNILQSLSVLGAVILLGCLWRRYAERSSPADNETAA